MFINKRIQQFSRKLEGASLRQRIRIVPFVLLFLFSSRLYGEFGSIVDVGLGGDFYFTRESANNGQGFVNLLIQNRWSDSELWLDIGAGGLVGENAASYIKAPQMYYRLGKKGGSYFTIGRAIHPWSFADDFWNLGLTQPNFRWDEARPEIQGLPGIFATIPIIKNKIEMTFLFSPLFIPSQGPSYEVINGKLTGTNPWFTEPVEVIDFSGKKLDATYQLNIPSVQEIIQQNTYAMQLSTPRNKKDGIVNLFVMDKPRNDLVLPFTAALNLSTQDVDVKVFPQVPRHTLYGADLGWNFGRAKTLFSWIYESAVEYDAPAGSRFPILPEQNIFSFNQMFTLSRTQKLTFGYMRTDGDATILGGDSTGSQISAIQKRNRFNEVLRVQLQSLLFPSKSLYKIRTNVTINKSLYRDNLWASADVRWSIHQGLEAFSKCDFFGGNEEIIVGQDFMSTYLNNDRCFLGAHYAF